MNHTRKGVPTHTLDNLLDAIPNNEPIAAGLKLWLVDRSGRLISPGTFTAAPDAPLMTANCPHGNTPPSRECPCGIHYLPNVERFFLVADHMAKLNPHLPTAVTIGIGIGRTLTDFLPNEKWAGATTLRSDRFLALRCLYADNVPERLAVLLRARSTVPTTRGATETHARRALDEIRAALSRRGDSGARMDKDTP
ncbi:hypothetical protein Q3O43_20065 [Rhodococcus aetherivorans]|uniref:hypothetical protein n=1 Tax=Rhodococcus aetherivorans TaxID=191292 RepID=UPI0026E973C2|nr:hypothetical protein [Rhodococcus aetherivorans]WKW97317.1 hypothetical protein Q3O43_20065 [Rhodococcus aetherivorans]